MPWYCFKEISVLIHFFYGNESLSELSKKYCNDKWLGWYVFKNFYSIFFSKL